MKNPPEVSVIIVNYNGVHLLEECLESLRQQTFRDFPVILVDNASTDGSVAFVKNAYTEVTVIENRENLGYGGGNNAGIRQSHGRYVVLLNNDTKVDPQSLEKLMGPAERDDNGKYSLAEILGWNIIEITTIGAKANQPRSMPLIGIMDGEKIALVASSFGRAHNPGWY